MGGSHTSDSDSSKYLTSHENMDRPKKIKPIDTLAITQSLGLQTFRKQSRRAWSKEDDEMLHSSLTQLYPNLIATPAFDANKVDWDAVAKVFGDARKGKECRKRWSASLDPNLRRGRWTEEEDRLLMEQYNEYGLLWQKIARNIQGRTEHQCSKRYLEILDPALRNRLKPWLEDEDLLLVRLVLQHGTKWKTIALELKLRPPLTCRNRWRNLVTAIARGRATPRIVEMMSNVVDGDIKSHFAVLSLEGAMGDGLGENANPLRYSLLNLNLHLHQRQHQHLQSDLDTVDGMEKQFAAPPFDAVRDAALGSYSIKQEYAGELETEPGSSSAFNGASGANDPAGIHADYQTSLSMSIDSPVSNGGTGMGGANKPTLSGAIPSRSETEWAYSLLQKQGTTGNSTAGQAEFSGTILSEQFVHYLVQHASKHNLDINVYHHVHHHYLNHAVDQPGLYPDEGQNSYASVIKFMDLEAQRKRNQHFNYLPPQTEVPRLTSSTVPAPHSSTHHHHHHHHHHHSGDVNTAAVEKGQSDQILNLSKDPLRMHTPNSAEKLVIEPLVEFDQFELLEPVSKKAKINIPADEEDGMEFFESLRHLGGRATGDKLKLNGTALTNEEDMADRPVSQHHPLHYSKRSSNVVGAETLLFDDEDEDMLDSYGLFYHLYTDPVVEKPSDDLPPFGAIPFNPS